MLSMKRMSKWYLLIFSLCLYLSLPSLGDCAYLGDNGISINKQLSSKRKLEERDVASFDFESPNQAYGILSPSELMLIRTNPKMLCKAGGDAEDAALIVLLVILVAASIALAAVAAHPRPH